MRSILAKKDIMSVNAHENPMIVRGRCRRKIRMLQGQFPCRLCGPRKHSPRSMIQGEVEDTSVLFSA